MTFMPITAIPLRICDRQELLGKAQDEMIQRGERHQHAVEGKALQGLHLHLRIPVSAHADVTDLPLLPGQDGRLQGPAGRGQLVQFLHVPDIVHPPFVDVIRLERYETLFEMDHRLRAGAAPGLGGDPHLLPPMLGHLTHALLRLSIGVHPGGVEVADPVIQGVVDHPDGVRLGALVGVHDPLRAETQDGEALPGPAERSRFHQPSPSQSVPIRHLFLTAKPPPEAAKGTVGHKKHKRHRISPGFQGRTARTLNTLVRFVPLVAIGSSP